MARQSLIGYIWGYVGQCYDAKFLKVYASMPSSPLQLEEDLEQLKVLENGYKLKVFNHQSFSVGVLVLIFVAMSFSSNTEWSPILEMR